MILSNLNKNALAAIEASLQTPQVKPIALNNLKQISPNPVGEVILPLSRYTKTYTILPFHLSGTYYVDTENSVHSGYIVGHDGSRAFPIGSPTGSWAGKNSPPITFPGDDGDYYYFLLIGRDDGTAPTVKLTRVTDNPKRAPLMFNEHTKLLSLRDLYLE